MHHSYIITNRDNSRANKSISQRISTEIGTLNEISDTEQNLIVDFTTNSTIIKQLVNEVQEIRKIQQNQKGIRLFCQRIDNKLTSFNEIELFNGLFKIKIETFICIIVELITYYTTLLQSVSLLDQDQVQENPSKLDLVAYLPQYCFIFIAIFQLIQFIENKISILVMIFFGIFVAIIILLTTKFNSEFEDQFLEIFLVITISNSYIIKLSSKWLEEKTFKIISILIKPQLFLFICYFIEFRLLYFYLGYITNNVKINLQNIKDIITVPLFFILLYFSIFLLFRFSQKQENIILMDINRLQHIKKDPKYISDKIEIFFTKLLTKTQIGVFCFYLFIIYYSIIMLSLFINFIYEFTAPIINLNRIYTFGILLFLVPIFLLLGIIISYSANQFINLLLWSSLSIALGSLITIKLWNIFLLDDTLSSLAQVLGISPIIVGCTWITVSYFRSERYVLKQVITTFLCTIYAYPIGILLPISNLNQGLQFDKIAYTLTLSGIAVIIIIFLYYFWKVLQILIKLPQQSRKLRFDNYLYYNLNDLAIVYSSFCFITSFFIICYFVWNQPEYATQTSQGTIYGLLILHPILYILINIAIRQESADSELDEYETILQNQQPMNQISNLTAIVICIVFVIIGAIEDKDILSTIYLSLSFGIPLIIIIFKLLVTVKNESQRYSNFFQPFLIIKLYTLVFIPFGVIVPCVSNYYQTDSKPFAIFVQVTVAYGLLFSIFGVTSLSLFFSVLLNKEYLELKRRSVLMQIMAKFNDHSVLCSSEICTLLFFRYIRDQDEDSLKQNLIEGNPVNVMEYKGMLREQYSKELLKSSECKALQKDINKVNNRLKKEQQQMKKIKKIQKPSDKKNILLQIIDFLLCRYGLQDLEKLESQRKKRFESIHRLEKRRDYYLNLFIFRQPDNHFIDSLKRNDFYVSLKYHPKKVERFWACLYEKFKNDITLLLFNLGIFFQEEELQNYNSYKAFRNKSYLSDLDFAQFLYLGIQEDQLTPFETFQKYAILLYPIIIFNLSDFQHQLKQIQVNDSAFSVNRLNQMEKEINIDYAIQFEPPNSKFYEVNRKLFIESDFEIRKQQINSKYNFSLSPWKTRLYHQCQLFHYYIWVYPLLKLRAYINSLIKAMKIQIQIPERTQPATDEPWPIIANDVADTLVEACEQFDNEMKIKEFEFNHNLGNYVQLLSRLSELYGLCALAFSIQVGWVQEQKIDTVDTIDGQSLWEKYDFFFGVSLGMSVIYVILGRQAIIQIQNNTFGLDEQGNPVTYKHPRFWSNRIITIISGQFLFVMKTFIDAFICDYDSYPYLLVRQREVECLTNYHFLYVALAFAGSVMYYPLSTFLQPTFQYSDPSLDLKYKSTYLVIHIQAKLMILGLSSVFSNLKEKAYQYQMLFSSFVIAILIYIFYKFQPCYVKVINRFELFIMFVMLYVYIGAFLILVTQIREIGWLFTLSLSFITLIYTITQYIRDKKIKQNQKIKTHPTQIDV